MSNKIISNGGFVPSSVDTPLDLRTRVQSVDDIYNIDLPYVGMIVYVIDEDKYYKVKTLKAKEIGVASAENAAVDTFEEFLIKGPQGDKGDQGEQGPAGQDADISNLMTKENPNGTGALSLNRKADTKVGECSSTLGYGCIASNEYSHAEGLFTRASEYCSHAEGSSTEAYGYHAHAEGSYTEAGGESAHAEGTQTRAYGHSSHAEGNYTIAKGSNQHVQGKYNIKDTEEKYAHIVGNGSSNSERANAHTLDWQGNAWYAGDVFIKGTSQDDAQKLATEDMVIALQQEVAELRTIIEELKNNSEPIKPEEPIEPEPDLEEYENSLENPNFDWNDPAIAEMYLSQPKIIEQIEELGSFKYAIANAYIVDDMNTLSTITEDKNITGIVISPNAYELDGKKYFNLELDFINNTTINTDYIKFYDIKSIGFCFDSPLLKTQMLYNFDASNGFEGLEEFSLNNITTELYEDDHALFNVNTDNLKVKCSVWFCFRVRYRKSDWNYDRTVTDTIYYHTLLNFKNLK